VEKLSELGVLFLLFEMGLELSIDRLRVSAAAIQRSTVQSSAVGMCIWDV
jgi:Kef-type K+ transport system membrane component KefB